MSLYKDARKVGGLYCLCATTCSETRHHWRVFTASADGACIEIKCQEFEASLVALPGVRFGEIDYPKVEEVEKLSGSAQIRSSDRNGRTSAVPIEGNLRK